MGNARKYFPLLATAGLLASSAAEATLFDRGGGLLYDDVLKVTWLQDANYAKTSGSDADGLMNWGDARAWAASLVYHDSVRGVDWGDWHLARINPVGADWNYTYSTNGSTDTAYNITSPHSELSYMYHVNLGLKSLVSPAGLYQPDFGIFRNGTYDGVGFGSFGQTDVGLVKNLQSEAYWSGSAMAIHPGVFAWGFDTKSGAQFFGDQYMQLYAWAVRCGDVAAVPATLTCDNWIAPEPVPEPETYALFLAGLAVMGRAVRRRRCFCPS